MQVAHARTCSRCLSGSSGMNSMDFFMLKDGAVGAPPAAPRVADVCSLDKSTGSGTYVDTAAVAEIKAEGHRQCRALCPERKHKMHFGGSRHSAMRWFLAKQLKQQPVALTLSSWRKLVLLD